MFTVAPMLDNSRTRRIGYQVVSQSKTGGTRVHSSKQGRPVLVADQDSPGLETARSDMAALAMKLEAEAEANRARSAA